MLFIERYKNQDIYWSIKAQCFVTLCGQYNYYTLPFMRKSIDHGITNPVTKKAQS